MLGLGASISTATSVGSWNPSRLPGVLMWFRFNHGITLDAQDDVTKWDNQSNDRNIGDINGTTDGGATTSPIMSADGAMYFDHAGNFLRFNPSGGSNYELNLFNYSNFASIGGMSKDSSFVKSLYTVLAFLPERDLASTYLPLSSMYN